MQRPTADTLGWLAAGLTAASFACTDMRRLRGGSWRPTRLASPTALLPG